MSKPETTVTEAADILGLTAVRVRQICRERGIGTMVSPRLRMLSAADLAALKTYKRERKIGRPFRQKSE